MPITECAYGNGQKGSNAHMYPITSPTGEQIQVPEYGAEDVMAFSRDSRKAVLEFFHQNGFALVRNLIPEEYCKRIQSSFNSEIKPRTGLLPRINGHDERNRFNENGFLINSLMNVQRKAIRGISTYTADVLAVLTHQHLKTMLEGFFHDGIGLMTWNHSESNPVTKPHCDAHFWTKDISVGDIVGVWIALETIHPGAGRLYVYPHSHEMDMRQLLAPQSDPNKAEERERESMVPLNVLSETYQQSIVNLIKSKGWSCTAPSLQAGDVLLWDARTIHGSLPTTTPQFSRSSLTSHFTAIRFIKKRNRRTRINGIGVAFPRFSLQTIKGLFSSIK